MADFSKDGYIEAVLFLFCRDGQILIEHRPEGDTFIPNGGVDTKDLSAADYRLAAVNREVMEEFEGKVQIEELHPLGEFVVPEIGVRFHGYAVLRWTGNVPNHTVEDGMKHADLEWVPSEETEKVLTWPCAHYFVRKARELRLV